MDFKFKKLALILVLVLLVPIMVLAIDINEDVKIKASDGGMDDGFGRAVAIRENVALVGAYHDDDQASDSGAAYVFEKQEGGWVETAKLTASDGEENDNFGVAVAVTENLAVIGAEGNNSHTGAVYVFEKQSGNWVETAKLTASDGESPDHFGLSVAISNSTIVIGAPKDGNGVHTLGSAYIFEKQGGSWVETAKLTDLDGNDGDDFGRSVAISSDTILIGAYGNNDTGLNRAGVTYVFEKQSGNWVETAKLTASDGEEDDYFGFHVSISGNTALIGAFGDDDIGGDSGSAYIFEKQGGSWVEVQKLAASDQAGGDDFGRVTAIVGNRALISAWVNDDAGTNSGSAYIFEKQGGSWVETTKLTASDAAAFDWFGWSISLSDTKALIGAFGDDDSGSVSGSAYIFELESVNPPEPILTITPGIADVWNILTASNATPEGKMHFNHSKDSETKLVDVPGCPEPLSVLKKTSSFGMAKVDSAGDAVLAELIKPKFSGETLFLQGVDRQNCQVTNVLEVTFYL